MVELSSSMYVKWKPLALFQLLYLSSLSYKSFKWVIIAGGRCAIIFFSIFNLAANGYVLDVRYDVQYNETVSSKHWTQHFPFSTVDTQTSAKGCLAASKPST
jgi:hypothetical protein